ncbi:SH3 domain-containing protein [Kurthia huakuii]|uniref:SH3 domain-containing protein n=1 Tax=Kurthia huakuii TaxID=1421019 RepID=UPI0004B2927A|nr:SH3 domain-containing protein [Kurthia huakuii]MBM7698624.1 uncharacterized protein YgiM (DUF1202 family) [Kurthia huakuii]
MARSLLKKWMMATGIAFSALGVGALVQPDFTVQAVQQVTTKYAQFNGVKAFEKPTISSAVVGTYTLNNPVHIVKTYNADFYEVRLDGQKGYVQKEYVQATPYFVKAVMVYAPHDTLNVRTGPGVKYRKFGAVAHNKPLYVTSDKTWGNWIQVWHKGKFGFVNKRYTVAPPWYTVRVPADDTLAVRTGPGVGYHQIGGLYNKDRVQVLAKTTSKWYQVYHRGEIGYVSAFYVTK